MWVEILWNTFCYCAWSEIYRKIAAEKCWIFFIWLAQKVTYVHTITEKSRKSVLLGVNFDCWGDWAGSRGKTRRNPTERTGWEERAAAQDRWNGGEGARASGENRSLAGRQRLHQRAADGAARLVTTGEETCVVCLSFNLWNIFFLAFCLQYG